ncbi:MAG: hypothetical protein AB7S26_40700 [Sandaracinaceae bacterium]
MRTSSILSLLLFLSSAGLGVAVAGCGAGGDPPRRDAGPGGGGRDGGGGGRDSSVLGGFDSGTARDSGPSIFADGGCMTATPLDTTIVGDPPDMLLVVDISGSMCSPLIDSFPPSMETKMAIMRNAVNRLVSTWDGRINFGLMFFPSDDMCGAGTIRNAIAPRNASAIMSTLGGLSVDLFGCALQNPGATPTAPSIDAARTYYGTIPVNPVGRFVLLATDGLPNCGPMQPDGSTGETVPETVAAIQALSSAGVPTYVLGLGDSFGGTGTSALNMMATAGGTSRPYPARSAAELDAALATIAAAVIPPSCTVEVTGATRDPMLFQVRFDGGPLIPRNMSHTSGWDYDPATNTITFYGADCTAVQSGSVMSVDVDFGCPGPLI